MSTMTEKQTIFFDSHGGAHVTLPWTSENLNDPRAGAFGPGKISRPLTDEELEAHGLLDSEKTPWSMAAGRRRTDGEWYVLDTTRFTDDGSRD